MLQDAGGGDLYLHRKILSAEATYDKFMSELLEILGSAITVDTSELIWNYLNALEVPKGSNKSAQHNQLAKIIELLGNINIDAAAKELRLYLFDNPSCIYGRLAAAAICLHKNLLGEAIEELNSVYLRQPNNIISLYALGHCFERLGKEEQAIEFYQDCLKFKDYLRYPSQRLAAIYLKNCQLEKTIHQYELLKSHYPDDISSLVALGHLYIASGRFDKAIETFNSAILIHPDNFLMDDEKIDHLIQTGYAHEALLQIEELLDKSPERPELIVKQADILSMLGDTAEAISQYQHALHLCPDFLDATIKLGTQYLQIESFQLAAVQFNKAVEINDKIVDAYIGLALSQKLAGKFSEALNTLSLASAIQPNSSFLFAETAKLLFKSVFSDNINYSYSNDSYNLIEAIFNAHRRHIERNPNNPDLYYRLGVLFMSINKIDCAIDSFQTALDLNPTHSWARNKLIICLLDSDRKDSAMEKLFIPDYLDKNSLILHYKVALLYCDRVKFASSLFNLERYLENNFASYEPVVNISIVLQNLGLLDRVSSMWESLSETANIALNKGN